MGRWQRAVAGALLVITATCVTAVDAHSDSYRWHVQTTPTPAGRWASFYAVSCASATNCLGVGSSWSASDPGRHLAERWNGTKWSVENVPIPVFDMVTFRGTACPTVSFCVAVGTDYGPLLAQWNGHTWTGGRNYGADGGFSDVTCTSATFCLAVGNGFDLSPLVVRWNGSSWAVDWSFPTSGRNTLEGVTCVSPTNCFVVRDPWEGNASSVVRWNGTKWTVQPIQAPAGNRPSHLQSVSCLAANKCLAVGYSGSYDRRLAEQWNGATWSIANTPGPATGDTEFYDVSCKAGQCALVGDTWSASTGYRPFAVRWNGTGFVSESVQPTAQSSNGTLWSVACVAATNCFSVGGAGPWNKPKTLAVHSS